MICYLGSETLRSMLQCCLYNLLASTTFTFQTDNPISSSEQCVDIIGLRDQNNESRSGGVSHYEVIITYDQEQKLYIDLSLVDKSFSNFCLSDFLDRFLKNSLINNFSLDSSSDDKFKLHPDIEDTKHLYYLLFSEIPLTLDA